MKEGLWGTPDYTDYNLLLRCRSLASVTYRGAVIEPTASSRNSGRWRGHTVGVGHSYGSSMIDRSSKSDGTEGLTYEYTGYAGLVLSFLCALERL